MKQCIQREARNEDANSVQSNFGNFTAHRAQSSETTLLEIVDDWKVQFDVIDEGVSVTERPLPCETDVVSGRKSEIRFYTQFHHTTA